MRDQTAAFIADLSDSSRLAAAKRLVDAPVSFVGVVVGNAVSFLRPLQILCVVDGQTLFAPENT